ncbi:MAG: serine--tRNA ligase, partial [Chthoniobacterales bacterium]
MLDLRLIREKPDFVKQCLATRGGDSYSLLVAELLRCDEQRRINETTVQRFR